MKTIGLIVKALALAAALAAPGASQCLIYGSSQPQAIPDDKAYALMFGTLTMGQGGTLAHNEARVSAYLALIGLSASDQAVFRSVLNQYGAQADILDQQIKAAGTPTTAAGPFNQRVALAGQAKSTLLASLSPAGAAAVVKHINERVKPRTVMQCPKN
jgi:hypothetical protein